MLEPRRGRYSGGYSWLSSGNSQWNKDVTFSMSRLRTPKSDFIAQLVFEFLTVGALLLFLFGTFAIRQPKALPRHLPKKGLVISILSYILRELLWIPQMFFYLCEVTVKQSYVVMSMLQTIFWLLALWFIFYVFYRIIQVYLDRTANGGKTFLPVIILHWIALGILGILMVVNAAMYIAIIVMQVNGDYFSRGLVSSYNKIAEARIIISWVMSLEVFLWTVFIIAKSRFGSKSGPIALALGSFFYFVFSLEQLIITAMYTMESKPPPTYLNLATSVVAFFCTVGLYFGIIFCCIQWCKASEIFSQEHFQPQPGLEAPVPYPPPMSSYQPYHPPAPQPPSHSTQSGYSSPANGGQFPPAELHSESDVTSGPSPIHQQHQSRPHVY